MSGYRVTLTAEQALAVGSGGKVGNVIDSHALVPGWTLRGALAALWIRDHGEPTPGDPAFRELFHGSLRFGPLLPEDASVVPVGVLRCKYRPASECAEVVFDVSAGDEAPQGRLCPACRGLLEPAKGELVGVDGVLTARTRTALDETDETAVHGSLFTRRAISAGTELHGRIEGRHPWLDEFDDAGDVRIRVGGQRSVGGSAVLRLAVDGETTDPRPRGRRVLLRCLTPAVLVGEAGEPLLDPSDSELRNRLGLVARVINRRVRSDTVGGWLAAAGVPKPRDLVVVAGSTWEMESEEEQSPAALGSLVRSGIGIRRSEGFGWVEVNPAPWRPPIAAGGAGVAASEANTGESSAVDTLRAALNYHQRRWLVGVVREAAVAREQNREPDASLSRVVRRSWPPTVLKAAEELISNPDVAELRAAAKRLVTR